MGLKTGIQLDHVDQKNLNRKLAALEKFSKIEANRVIHHAADQTVGRMKKQVTAMDAVDTGRLRRNINVKNRSGRDTVIESKAIDPTTGKNYAPTVNYGLGPGRNSVARPYFTNGIRYLTSRLRKDLTKALNKITKT